MEMVQVRAGGRPIAAFVVGTGAPYGPESVEAVAEIAARRKIILLNGIDGAIRAAQTAGAITRAEDGTGWNELGHRIAAEAIANGLRSVCLLNLC